MALLEKQDQLRDAYKGEAIVYKVTQDNQRCRVRFNGIDWTAEAVAPFPLKTEIRVRVIGLGNSVLLIEPLPSPSMNDRNKN
jgi:membrane protein implicated in regulation of membrane protease activity